MELIKNKKIKTVFKIITIIIILSKNLYSNSAIDVLKNDVSASVLAMAGSNAALNLDIFSVNYNPATLGEIKSYQTAISYSNGFEDATYSYAALGMPFPTNIISNISKPYIAMSIYMTSLGDFIDRRINPDGTISEKKINAEKNTIVSFSYAEKITKETVIISPTIKSKFESNIGIGVKFIDSKLLDKYSANTVAVDAGYYGNFVDIGFDFGISVSNAIGSIKYIEEKYNLPTILRVAASYSKPTIMDQRTKISCEFDRYINDKQNSLRIGLEYTFEKIMSIRTGYRFLEDNKGLSIGVGLFAGGFSIDIATVFYDVYKYSSVSIKFKFGKQVEEEKQSKELKKFIEKEEKKTDRPSRPKTSPLKNQIIVF
ncbi:MAG: hypothetical protein K6357_02085 [Elusimicrobiota bacterium]